jgi:hypothetical protein
MRFLDAWSLQPGFKGHIRRRLISQPTFVIRSARPTLAEVPSAHLSFLYPLIGFVAGKPFWGFTLAAFTLNFRSPAS